MQQRKDELRCDSRFKFCGKTQRLAGVSAGNLLVATRKPEARQTVQKVSPISQETVHCFEQSDTFEAAKTLTEFMKKRLLFFFRPPVARYNFPFSSY